MKLAADRASCQSGKTGNLLSSSCAKQNLRATRIFARQGAAPSQEAERQISCQKKRHEGSHQDKKCNRDSFELPFID